jgi:hypothetical protein
MATWCEVQSELARATLKFFEQWPDAWSIYCGRDKHPLWPDLDFGERLHVIFYFLDDLIGDVRDIDGQEFIGDRIALEYMLGHVRVHVAGGGKKTCGCCDPSWPAPSGTITADYRKAKEVTTLEVLDQLAEKIARAKAVSTGMVVRMMYARPHVEAESAVAQA